MKNDLMVLKQRTMPCKWAKHNGELESFTSMHGNNFYGVVIAFETQQVGFRFRGLGLSLLGQPFEQTGHSLLIFSRFMVKNFH